MVQQPSQPPSSLLLSIIGIEKIFRMCLIASGVLTKPDLAEREVQRYRVGTRDRSSDRSTSWGKITVSSQVEVGSCFQVRLPLSS
ncbi:MAG TPA: hypothetical protein V6D14_31510 [Coleofasciculaceae cyanobacterium]